jgi:hypothetical protein
MVVVRGPSVGRGGLGPLIMVVVRRPSVGRGGLRCLFIRSVKFYIVFIMFDNVFMLVYIVVILDLIWVYIGSIWFL